MTRLATYFRETGETQGDLAARVGTSASTICRIASGKIRPSLDLAFAIQRVTENAVPVASWEPETEGPA